MKGYWGSRFKKQSIGWITGDLATMDEEGYIKSLAVVKIWLSVVVRIFIGRIENYLYRHPKISDVRVVLIKNTVKCSLLGLLQKRGANRG